MNIQDVMTPDVSYVRPDTPILEIARKMRDADIGSMPVVDDDRLVGMVTDRDIVVRVIAEGARDRNGDGARRDVAGRSVLLRR